MIAVSCGRREIVELLLKHGHKIDFHATDQFKRNVYTDAVLRYIYYPEYLDYYTGQFIKENTENFKRILEILVNYARKNNLQLKLTELIS